MSDNFEKTIQALMNGVEEHISTKTIVGEPINCNGAVIFPMADVSFGIAAGALNQEKKNNESGGVGARVTPSAVLIIQNGNARIVNIKDKDSINKLIDMIPDAVNKITGFFDKSGSEPLREEPLRENVPTEEPPAEE